MNPIGPDTAAPHPRASIIVSSYNYAPYLRRSIDSALAQSAPDTEVIVVDDGSTDGSAEIIRSFGDRVAAIIKPNGGQASAWNAGFVRSRGQVVIFLDSDDLLDPTAAADALGRFAAGDLSKVHWPLRIVDAEDRPDGRVVPPGPLPTGDLRDQVLRGGVVGYAWPPTSGNAWSRRFLEQVMPIPEAEYVICPDLYLSVLAPLFGPLDAIDSPRGAWRVHGGNNSWRSSVDRRLDALIDRLDHSFGVLEVMANRQGLAANRASWSGQPWLSYLRRVRQAIADIVAAVPEGARFILIDEDQWETSDVIAGRHRTPFLEHAGRYWGPPADGQQAVREMERLCRAGAGYLAVGWPGFWWLDHYSELRERLASARRVLNNDRVIVYDLSDSGIDA